MKIRLKSTLRAFLSTILICCSLLVTAQTNYLNTSNSYGSYGVPTYAGLKDSSKVHSPRKATIYSALIPGLGQAYNDKYWKVGIIYAGAFTMGYLYKFNRDSMNRYQEALTARIDTSAATIDVWYPQLTDAKVTQERNFYRRNRDRLILGFFGLYALQIIDANVDAHLKEFEINDDLSLKIKPSLDYIPSQMAVAPSLHLRLRF